MSVRRIPISASNWRTDWRTDPTVGPLTLILSVAEDDSTIEVLVPEFPDGTLELAIIDLSAEKQAAAPTAGVDQQHHNRQRDSYRGHSQQQHRQRQLEILLREGLVIAAERRCRFTRTVVSNPVDDHLRMTLRHTGFREAGVLEERRRRGSPKTSDNVGLSSPATGSAMPSSTIFSAPAVNMIPGGCVMLTAVNSVHEFRVEDDSLFVPVSDITNLLKSCLEASDDLRDLPRTNAADLLQIWRLTTASLRLHVSAERITAKRNTAKRNTTNGLLSGLMVVNHDGPAPESVPADDQNAVAACDDSTGHAASHTIEYLGVLPEKRRQKIATTLLNAADNASCLTVFVGTDNVPAKAFYHQHGFNPVAQRTVFVAESGPSRK